MQSEEDVFIELLYREHFRKLWSYAAAALKNPDLASEVVQDVFHDAVKRADKLLHHENPAGWLRLALKYKLMHVRRSMNLHVLHCISLDSDLDDRNPALASDGISHNHVPEILQEVQRILKPGEWDLFRSIILDEMPYKEVSQQLGESVWTCQKRIQRIREKLRKHFSADF